jgi:formylglycine-generating enzyme required for sulfatase activity
MMYALRIALKPKSGATWPWFADLIRPDDLLPLQYDGQFNLQLGPLQMTSDLRQYGKLLGEALFQGDLREAFTNALAGARKEGWLRVQLHIDRDAPELRSLHWERLLAPIDGRWEFLALNQSTPYSIFQNSRSDRAFPPLTSGELSILLALANPANLGEYNLHPFDTRGTLESLTQALGELPITVLTDELPAHPSLQVSGLPTLDAICQALSEASYPLLHLVCHGRVVERTGETVLFLSTPDGQAAPVEGSDWITRLSPLKNLPHLVFLSTCESADPRAESGLGGLAQRMVRDLGIPAVLAMTGKVSIATAQALAGPFYRLLAQHGQPDRALGEALSGLAERADFNVPALFTRLRDGQLFGPESASEAPPAGVVTGDQFNMSGDFRGATIYIKSEVKADQAERVTVPVARKPYEPEMVEISSGGFWMGHDPAPGFPPYETPRSLIELPAFLMSKYPITNREYAEYVRQTRITVPVELGWEGRNPTKDQLNLPVRGVTWGEALDYCAWLSQQTGHAYLLPSEAQWEKAARGVDGRLFPWGEAWEAGRCNQGSARTAAVTAFPQQSSYGLHDLVGNVLQWTTTLWGERRLQPDYLYPWQPDDGRDELAANRQVRRILRGSAYSDPPAACACSARRSFLPGDRGQPGKRHGFRVVRQI